MNKVCFLLTAILSTGAVGQPFGDSIPAAFRGTFAPSLKACGTPYGVDLIEVTANRVHYYEGDDYLLLGVAFEGESTSGKSMVPLFNGRFTGRMETQILGETTVRMEMDTPNMLVRYTFDADGNIDPKPADRLVRCPKGSSGQ